jgi:hypothetical protein
MTPATSAPPPAARASAAGRLPGLAGAARRYGFALAAMAAVAIGLAGLWAVGALTHGHDEHSGPVALRTTAPVGDLSVAVMSVQRLRDGHAGVNSPRLPMSGPAMPMSSMGEIGGALKAGQEQIAVTVTLRNPTDKPVSYDAGRLLLVSKGREVPLLKPTRSTLGDGVLRPGSQISGGIFYTVKAGAAPLSLQDVKTDTVFTLDRRTSVPGSKAAAEGDGHGH